MPPLGPNKRSKGDGSVYQRASDGMWMASFELPNTGEKTKSGKPKRNRALVSASTEGQAREKMRQAKIKHAQGKLTTGQITLSAWLDYWYRQISQKKNKVRTTRGYRTYLEQYIKPSIGNVRLDKLTPAHVRKLHDFVLNKEKPKKDENDPTEYLSSTTALQAHNILSVALKYAMQEEKVTRNVATLVDRPQKADKDLSILTAADAIKVLAATRYERLGSRWAMALLTGARQGEVLGLELDRVTANQLDLSWQLQRITWEHGCNNKCGRARGVDCPDRHVFTPRHLEFRSVTDGLRLSRPKSRAGRRIIRLVPPLRDVIELRVHEASSEPNPHGLVWTADPKKSKGGAHALLPLDGSPIDPSRDNRAWHEALKRSGVPDVRLHDARHTTASLLQKAGVSEAVITQILGHSAFITSMGYMDFDDEQMDSAMLAIAGQLDPQLGG